MNPLPNLSQSPAAVRPARQVRSFGAGVRPAPTRGAILRRRLFVGTSKRLLPLAAVALLAVVAMWPEIERQADRARMAWQMPRGASEVGRLKDPRYHGLDEHGQPYLVTAVTAHQVGPDRIDMVDPVGDLNTDSGAWTQVQAETGVYMQKGGQLDLSGNVLLYRDDGTTLRTETASVDVREGAAASADRTHVEGPFGTLDAQGFSLTDRGMLVHFIGPGRLLLNGSGK